MFSKNDLYRNEHPEAFSNNANTTKQAAPEPPKAKETPKLAESDKSEKKEETAKTVHEGTTDAKSAAYEAFNTAVLNDPKADYVRGSLDAGELLQRDSIMDTVAHKKEQEAKKHELEQKNKEGEQHQLDEKQKAEDKKKREDAKKQLKNHQHASFMFKIGEGLHYMMAKLFGSN